MHLDCALWDSLLQEWDSKHGSDGTEIEKFHTLHLPYMCSLGKLLQELAAWPEGWTSMEVIACVGRDWCVLAREDMLKTG